MENDKVRQLLSGDLRDTEGDFARLLQTPMTIAEMMAISDDVDRTIQRLRTALWSEFQVADMLRQITSTDPALRTAALLASLHIETGAHATAIRATYAARQRGIAVDRDSIRYMLDPDKCRRLIDSTMPLIYDGKAKIIDGL